MIEVKLNEKASVTEKIFRKGNESYIVNKNQWLKFPDELEEFFKSKECEIRKTGIISAVKPKTEKITEKEKKQTKLTLKKK